MKYKLIDPVIKNDNLNVIDRVLTNRGIPLEDVEHYLHTCADDVIDPSGIVRIKEGAQLLIRHLLNQDKIFVLVDSDADGFTSSALLINYLNALFPGLTQNNIYYGYHQGKGHGLSDTLDFILQNDYKLIICPDSSSNDYEEHKKCAELGIDVLVIDHHEADKVSEYACIINNQLCDYPNKALSGAGMVYKFCCYLDQILKKDVANDFIDLAILGIIADMMDLRPFEIRELINEGFNNLRNPFFKEMIASNKSAIDRAGGVNPHTVGFYVAPFINAVTRIGSMEEKNLLFESMLDFKAYELIPSTKRGCKGQFEPRVTQAVRTSKNIKTHQNKIIDQNYENISKTIEQDRLLDKNKLLIIKLNDNSIPREIIGLVANKLANEYQRPTLVLRYDEISNQWSGSGRGYGIDDFRNFVEQTNLVEFAQGHATAFGVAILNENMEKFVTLTNELLKDQLFVQTTLVDFIWDGMDLNYYDILDLGLAKSLWGQNLDEPVIAIENIKLTTNNIQLLKGNTVKITLNDGISLIKFRVSEEECDKIYPDINGRITINILGKCSINEWMGNISPQILIDDWEIVESIKYLF